MKIKDFELVEENVQDIRFGQLNIYMSVVDNELLIMEKKRSSKSKEDYSFSCMQAEERLKLNHPNILQMLWVDKIDKDFTTNAFFKYPNEDLFEREQFLKNSKEMVNFLNDMLEAMTYLQKHKMVHGDFRPEYVYYDEASQKYILLDRLIDSSPANIAQMNNIFYHEKALFMSPAMFNNLIKNSKKFKHNPFKSEVFALGMVFISLFVDEDLISACYDFNNKIFQESKLKEIEKKLKKEIFTSKIDDLICEFLFLCILNLNEKERLTPKKALRVLRKGVKKTISVIEKKIAMKSEISKNMNWTNVSNNTTQTNSINMPSQASNNIFHMTGIPNINKNKEMSENNNDSIDISNNQDMSSKRELNEFVLDQSFSQNNNNSNDTFYGSGSNQTDGLLALNDIYNPNNIKKLTNFLENEKQNLNNFISEKGKEEDLIQHKKFNSNQIKQEKKLESKQSKKKLIDHKRVNTNELIHLSQKIIDDGSIFRKNVKNNIEKEIAESYDISQSQLGFKQSSKFDNKSEIHSPTMSPEMNKDYMSGSIYEKLQNCVISSSKKLFDQSKNIQFKEKKSNESENINYDTNKLIEEGQRNFFSYGQNEEIENNSEFEQDHLTSSFKDVNSEKSKLTEKRNLDSLRRENMNIKVKDQISMKSEQNLNSKKFCSEKSFKKNSESFQFQKQSVKNFDIAFPTNNNSKRSENDYFISLNSYNQNISSNIKTDSNIEKKSLTDTFDNEMRSIKNPEKIDSKNKISKSETDDQRDISIENELVIGNSEYQTKDLNQNISIDSQNNDPIEQTFSVNSDSHKLTDSTVNKLISQNINRNKISSSNISDKEKLLQKTANKVKSKSSQILDSIIELKPQPNFDYKSNENSSKQNDFHNDKIELVPKGHCKKISFANLNNNIKIIDNTDFRKNNFKSEENKNYKSYNIENNLEIHKSNEMNYLIKSSSHKFINKNQKDFYNSNDLYSIKENEPFIDTFGEKPIASSLLSKNQNKQNLGILKKNYEIEEMSSFVFHFPKTKKKDQIVVQIVQQNNYVFNKKKIRNFEKSCQTQKENNLNIQKMKKFIFKKEKTSIKNQETQTNSSNVFDRINSLNHLSKFYQTEKSDNREMKIGFEISDINEEIDLKVQSEITSKVESDFTSKNNSYSVAKSNFTAKKSLVQNSNIFEIQDCNISPNIKKSIVKVFSNKEIQTHDFAFDQIKSNLLSPLIEKCKLEEEMIKFSFIKNFEEKSESRDLLSVLKNKINADYSNFSSTGPKSQFLVREKRNFDLIKSEMTKKEEDKSEENYLYYENEDLDNQKRRDEEENNSLDEIYIQSEIEIPKQRFSVKSDKRFLICSDQLINLQRIREEINEQICEDFDTNPNQDQINSQNNEMFSSIKRSKSYENKNLNDYDKIDKNLNQSQKNSESESIQNHSSNKRKDKVIIKPKNFDNSFSNNDEDENENENENEEYNYQEENVKDENFECEITITENYNFTNLNEIGEITSTVDIDKQDNHLNISKNNSNIYEQKLKIENENEKKNKTVTINLPNNSESLSLCFQTQDFSKNNLENNNILTIEPKEFGNTNLSKIELRQSLSDNNTFVSANRKLDEQFTNKKLDSKSHFKNLNQKNQEIEKNCETNQKSYLKVEKNKEFDSSPNKTFLLSKNSIGLNKNQNISSFHISQTPTQNYITSNSKFFTKASSPDKLLKKDLLSIQNSSFTHFRNKNDLNRLKISQIPNQSFISEKRNNMQKNIISEKKFISQNSKDRMNRFENQSSTIIQKMQKNKNILKMGDIQKAKEELFPKNKISTTKIASNKINHSSKNIVENLSRKVDSNIYSTNQKRSLSPVGQYRNIIVTEEKRFGLTIRRKSTEPRDSSIKKSIPLSGASITKRERSFENVKSFEVKNTSSIILEKQKSKRENYFINQKQNLVNEKDNSFIGYSKLTDRVVSENSFIINNKNISTNLNSQPKVNSYVGRVVRQISPVPSSKNMTHFKLVETESKIKESLNKPTNNKFEQPKIINHSNQYGWKEVRSTSPNRRFCLIKPQSHKRNSSAILNKNTGNTSKPVQKVVVSDQRDLSSILPRITELTSFKESNYSNGSSFNKESFYKQNLSSNNLNDISKFSNYYLQNPPPKRIIHSKDFKNKNILNFKKKESNIKDIIYKNIVNKNVDIKDYQTPSFENANFFESGKAK